MIKTMGRERWQTEDNLGASTPQGPVLQEMSRHTHLMRGLYPDLDRVSVDFLFYSFLTLYSRFGRFTYGPITIDCRVIEELLERTYRRVAPGAKVGPNDESATRFYRQLAAELAGSRSRNVDELHWLLAFMHTDEGLPAKVFGELGISPEAIERFARAEHVPVSPGHRPAEKLYTPEEVAEYLGVHVQTVRIWIRSGKLPARKLAGQRALRIRESDLEVVLEPVEANNPTEEQKR